MKDAVKLLLGRADTIKKDAEESYEYNNRLLQEKLDKAKTESKNLIKAAQEICPHDEGVRTEEFEDYHKGTVDRTEYCEICDKILRC